MLSWTSRYASIRNLRIRFNFYEIHFKIYQLNIHINYKAQKSFINNFAAFNAVVFFIIAMVIPAVYAIFGQIELLSPMPIITYVFMVFVRLFTMSQLFLACLAIRKRFQLFNVYKNQLLNATDPSFINFATSSNLLTSV